MPQLVTWLVFDNITRAQEVVNRIGAWCGFCDGSGGVVWGPVYENLAAEGGAQYAVEFNNTLMQAPGYTEPKVWNCTLTGNEVTPINNINHVVANDGDPLFTAEDLGHLAEIDFSLFSEHDYSPPPEE